MEFPSYELKEARKWKIVRMGSEKIQLVATKMFLIVVLQAAGLARGLNIIIMFYVFWWLMIAIFQVVEVKI